MANSAALVLLACFAAAGCKQAVADNAALSGRNCQREFLTLTGRVVDDADMLSTAQEQKLTASLERLEKRTAHQMVIATVRSLDGRDVSTYTDCLGTKWGIGRKNINDGVILLVAPHDRQVRISVGDGLSKVLTDEEAGSIIRNQMMTELEKGEIARGIEKGADAVVRELN